MCLHAEVSAHLSKSFLSFIANAWIRSATKVAVCICYQVWRKVQELLPFSLHQSFKIFFILAVLTFTGNSAENIWGNCCNPFHNCKCNEMLFCAAGMKCSSQHFIPHSCWEPWKIMRKITIILQGDLSMASTCKGKNSFYILEARGLIKIIAFWKKQAYWKS